MRDTASTDSAEWGFKGSLFMDILTNKPSKSLLRYNVDDVRFEHERQLP